MKTSPFGHTWVWTVAYDMLYKALRSDVIIVKSEVNALIFLSILYKYMGSYLAELHFWGGKFQ